MIDLGCFLMDVGWQVLKVLEGHTFYVLAVSLSTDGSKIVSGSGDGSVRVWSADTGEVPCWICQSIMSLIVCVSVIDWFMTLQAAS